MSKTVAVIGGGVAGLETSIQLEKLGSDVNLYEKDDQLGGHVGKWDKLFPNRRYATEVIDSLTSRIKDKVQINLTAQVNEIKRENDSFLAHANGRSQKEVGFLLPFLFNLTPQYEIFHTAKLIIQSNCTLKRLI